MKNTIKHQIHNPYGEPYVGISKIISIKSRHVWIHKGKAIVQPLNSKLKDYIDQNMKIIHNDFILEILVKKYLNNESCIESRRT